MGEWNASMRPWERERERERGGGGGSKTKSRKEGTSLRAWETSQRPRVPPGDNWGEGEEADATS